MRGHQAGREKCIKHGLHKGAVGWLVRRCAGIRQEEPAGGCPGPNVRRNRDRTSGADTLCDEGEWRGELGLERRR